MIIELLDRDKNIVKIKSIDEIPKDLNLKIDGQLVFNWFRLMQASIFIR